jgi:hypothetical protein
LNVLRHIDRTTNHSALVPLLSMKGDKHTNPANVQLRAMVQDRKGEYHNSNSDDEKNRIIQEVVEAFRGGASPRRRFLGRFTKDSDLWSEAKGSKVRDAVRRLFLRNDVRSTPGTAGVFPGPVSAQGVRAASVFVTPSPRRRTTKRAKGSQLHHDFRHWDPFAAASEDDTNASSYGTIHHTTDKGRKRVMSARSGSEKDMSYAITKVAAPRLLSSPYTDVEPQGLSINALNIHDVLCDADGCRRAARKGTGDAKVVKLVRYFRRHPRSGTDETSMAEIIVSQIGLSIPPGRFFEEGENGKWYEAGTSSIVGGMM